MNLLPRPQEIKWSSGSHCIKESLRDEVKGALLPLKPMEGILFQMNPYLKNECYILQISTDKIIIDHGDDRGALWALRTLEQLINAQGLELSCMTIEDWPALANRGLLLDISRNRVHRRKEIKKVIDRMSQLKYNHLQLYIEHTFAYKGHSRAWRGASPLRPSDILAIEEYASRRGIELVANQNSYGHMERWLKWPRYRHLAELNERYTDPWGIERRVPSTLRPQWQPTYLFLEGLYDQLFPLFRSPWVNLGGDEPFEHCKGKSSGLGEPGQVYLDHILWLHGAAKKRGKKLMIWGDMVKNYPQYLKDFPEDVLFLEWGYDADWPLVEADLLYKKHHRAYWICPGTSSWQSLGFRWKNARANIEMAAQQCLHAQGLLLCDWGDNGHWQQPFSMVLPMVLAGALAWNRRQNPQDQDIADWLSRGDSQQNWNTLFTLAKLPMADCHVLNGTLANACMMDFFFPAYRQYLEEHRAHDFDQDIAIVEDSMATLPDSASESLHFSARFLLFSLRYSRELLKVEDFTPERIPMERRMHLAKELRQLLPSFRKLWLRQAKRGGLKDSQKPLNDLIGRLEGSQSTA